MAIPTTPSFRLKSRAALVAIPALATLMGLSPTIHARLDAKSASATPSPQVPGEKVLEVPTGSNLLDHEVVTYVSRSAKALFSEVGGTQTVQITKVGARPEDVQLSWTLPAEATQVVSGKRVRLEFAAQASEDVSIVVRGQLAGGPQTNVGLDQKVEVPTQWRKFTLDFLVLPGAEGSLTLPTFNLSSTSPGSVSIRGVSLRLLERPIPPSRPIRDLSGIFRWHEALPARFAAGAFGDIVGAWSPGYVDTFVQKGGAKNELDRRAAVDQMQFQIDYKGRFTNGPSEVWVKSITQSGPSAVVTGFWSGSWRIVPQGQIEGMDLPLDGGESFSGDFKATWKKVEGVWKQTSFEHRAYRVPAPKEAAATKAAHVALRKKLVAKKK